MATAAETPRTATVARMRVRALEKRYELRKSLLARFAYRFGSDTKRVALIEAELSKWPQLEQGQPLSRADLAALEQAVQAAVARAVHAKSIPPIESYSEDLGAVANWNCLAEHQAQHARPPRISRDVQPACRGQLVNLPPGALCWRGEAQRAGRRGEAEGGAGLNRKVRLCLAQHDTSIAPTRPCAVPGTSGLSWSSDGGRPRKPRRRSCP